MLSVITFAASFIIGVFAFSQIIGTFQNLGAFRPAYSIFLIVLWSGILFGAWYLLGRVFPTAVTAIYWGYGISLILVLGSGRIR